MGKKASSNYDPKKCKNDSTQRMALKGTIELFAVNVYWYKTSKAKKVLCKKLLEFPCKSGQ
jgi:hypothetical protein